jgi:putative SOS response-associated peptidase YedK
MLPASLRNAQGNSCNRRQVLYVPINFWIAVTSVQFAVSSRPVLHLGPVRQRRITPMRWGWPDMHAADPSKGFRHLHARSEDIDRTPTWIEPFNETRGVVFTKSFNIGETLPSGKTKQWVCSRADREAVAIAVIYSSWELPQGIFRAFAMITTASCVPLNPKDERMPALLELDEVSS